MKAFETDYSYWCLGTLVVGIVANMIYVCVHMLISRAVCGFPCLTLQCDSVASLSKLVIMWSMIVTSCDMK